MLILWPFDSIVMIDGCRRRVLAIFIYNSFASVGHTHIDGSEVLDEVVVGVRCTSVICNSPHTGS